MKNTKLTLVAGALLAISQANAAELITNGGFETGDFTGWATAVWAGSSGNIFVDNDGSSPQNGFPNAGPASGSFFAVTDQGGPGAYSLTQAFTVPSGSSAVTLSLSYFVNNQSGVVINAGNFDPFAGPNQHASIDILAIGAGPFDPGINLWSGEFNPENPDDWDSLTFDLTSIVSPGGSYLLRIAEVDNQLFYSLGIDDVSIIAEGTPVPEVHTYAGLLAIGMMGAEALRRRRAAR